MVLSKRLFLGIVIGTSVTVLFFAIGFMIAVNVHGGRTSGEAGLVWGMIILYGGGIALGGGALIGGLAGLGDRVLMGFASALCAAVLGLVILFVALDDATLKEFILFPAIGIAVGWTLSGGASVVVRWFMNRARPEQVEGLSESAA